MNVATYTVEKITPTGQMTASRGNRAIRINKNGRVMGGTHANRIVSESVAGEIRLGMVERAMFRLIRDEAAKMDRAASNRNIGGVKTAVAAIAKALGQ